MGWAVGYDSHWNRDIGYGVPAVCDHPRCNAAIDRGLGYVCGSDPYGGEHGCGLFFCGSHLLHRQTRSGKNVMNCHRCADHKPPYKHPKPDTAEWLEHKLTDPSWEEWRSTHPAEVAAAREALA